jgi:hypothetical protein
MSYQRVEGVVSSAGANAIDEQAGLGIALLRGKGMDPRGRWSVAVNFIESYFNLILSPPSDGRRSTASATGNLQQLVGVYFCPFLQ